jgi:ABC-type multidrug transport system ATPase subunit
LRVLVIQGVGKQYRGGNWGLQDFSLELGPGILGLLGPNGAGKSTLLRILATVSRPTGGSVTWNGQDVLRRPDLLREQLGYLPQDFGVYPNLTAREFLDYLAAARGLPAAAARRRIDELLALVNLVEAGRRPLGGWSGGMRQRLGIAQALLNDPKLLIVDEPTVGLDPEERARFRHLLSELAGDRVVILSTHIVSDVEATAGTIALIHQGRLLRHAPPGDLVAAVEGQVWEWPVAPAALPDIRGRYRVSGVLRRGERLLVRLLAPGAPSDEARSVPATLEDAYLHFVPAAGVTGA